MRQPLSLSRAHTHTRTYSHTGGTCTYADTHVRRRKGGETAADAASSRQLDGAAAATGCSKVGIWLPRQAVVAEHLLPVAIVGRCFNQIVSERDAERHAERAQVRGSNVAGFTRTDGTRTGIRRHDAPACRQFLADGAEEHRLTPLPIAVRAVCVRAMDDVGPLTRARAQGEVSLRCGPGFAQTRAALVLAESAESRNLGGLANRGGASARDAACTLGVYRRGRPEGRRADRAQPQHRPQPPGLHCDHCMCIVASSCAHRKTWRCAHHGLWRSSARAGSAGGADAAAVAGERARSGEVVLVQAPPFHSSSRRDVRSRSFRLCVQRATARAVCGSGVAPGAGVRRPRARARTRTQVRARSARTFITHARKHPSLTARATPRCSHVCAQPRQRRRRSPCAPPFARARRRGDRRCQHVLVQDRRNAVDRRGEQQSHRNAGMRSMRGTRNINARAHS